MKLFRTVSLLGMIWLTACQNLLNQDLIRARDIELYGNANPWEKESAQTLPKLGEKSTLQDYIDYAIAHNAGLRAGYEKWQAALARIPQMSALPDPRLSYQRMTKDGDNRFALSTEIPWPGKLQTTATLGEKEAEVIWWEVMETQLELLKELKNTYFEYAYLARAIAITEKTVQLLRQFEPLIRSRAESSDDQGEWFRIQVEIGKLENELQTLQQYRPTLSRKLNSLLNREENSLLPWPEPLEIHPIKTPKEELASIAAKNNPKLNSLLEVKKSRTVQVDLAKFNRKPDFMIEAEFEDQETFGEFGKEKNRFALGVSINLPIWARKLDSAENEARWSLSQSEREYQQERNDLYAELEMSVYQMDNAWRQVPLYRDTLIPAAKQLVEWTSSRYQANKATLFEWIDAQRNLLSLEIGFWRNLSDFEIAVAEIENCCGVPLR